MAEYYLSSTGNDAGSGSLSDPWLTLKRAVASSADGSAPTLYVQPGTYAATSLALKHPITLNALGQVVVEPVTTHGPWTQVQLGGYPVWHAATINLPAGQRVAQATCQEGTNPRRRIPVWNPAAPLDTPDKWAAAVLSPANVHTRWGLYSTPTDLYLIPPVDGSWSDPNSVHILTGYQPGFSINGPDVTVTGPFELPAHTMGIRLDSAAMRAHVDGLMADCNGVGIGILGGINPIAYGQDHLFEHCLLRDEGSFIPAGSDPPMSGQGISWNMIKTAMDLGIRNPAGVPVLVSKPLTGSETCGFWTSGGSLNTTVQDCEIVGSFDGASHYEDGRYDSRADTNLTFRRVLFQDHADDTWDRSRDQNGVLFEDCRCFNVGTILSPAPLWGSVTLRRVTGARIGDQARIPDGTGKRPHGSVVKYGASDSKHSQGAVVLDDCLFWSDTDTTQGICPDGGDGVLVPRLTLKRSTIRVPGIVLNWGAAYPHPADWLTLTDSILATSGSRALKVQKDLAATLTTAAADVDARYYSPSTGQWTYP